MSKIILGKKPETFKPFPVTFTMPDGTEGNIEATFAYRTRTEFGKMLNQMFADAGEAAPADGQTDFEAIFAKTCDKNAQHLLGSLKAWSLDEPLTLKTLEELCDGFPAAAAALMRAYSTACNEGRLGN